jgi:hypothetical protein
MAEGWQSQSMSNDQLSWPYVFPFFFVGMWLLITTILGFISGWFSLQRRYASGDENAVFTLRGRSGSMGMGVALNGIITLGTCPSGLRISIWKIFAPFQRPILIPCKDIRATPSRSLFAPATQLSFGAPEIGRLKIDARSWERLRNAAAELNARDIPPAPPHVTKATTAKAMLLQWAVVTLGAGCFFYFVPRLQGVQTGLPIVVCFGFPAIVFGFGIAVRFLRQA